MSLLSEKDIEYIAGLARLSLTAEEKARYARQLSVVFNYVSQLNEVDTDEVAETCQVTGLIDVVRADEVQECDAEVKNKLISSFPAHKAKLLSVPAVFE